MRALLVLLLPTAALASSETDLPPALRADVALGYEARFEWAGLEEDGDEGAVEVGRRRDVRHDLTVRAAFAPVDGVAFTVGLDAGQRRVSFVDGRRMFQDPVTGKGTSLDAPPLETSPETTGSGLEGVWLGMAFQPFAEHFQKQHAVTWRLDVAVRTAPGRSFWETDDAGKRGIGAGRETFRLAAAFSREHAATSPYMTAAWQIQTRRQVLLEDASGQEVAVQVDPGQRLDVRGGIELRLSNETVDTPAVDLDLHLGFGYRSPARRPSGVFLPDVLSSTRGVALQRAEQLGWHAGAGFDVDIADPLAWRIWSRAWWALPWRVEQAYSVRTSVDTLQFGVGTELVGRFR